jgi:hypothetical protein
VEFGPYQDGKSKQTILYGTYCFLRENCNSMIDTSLKDIQMKMWYLYTMEFYSVTKKNETLSLAGKWIELENILLSKVSQAQKAKNCMFSLICRL